MPWWLELTTIPKKWHGQEENHQETKTKAFMKVQPPHAHRSSVDIPLDKDVFRDTVSECKPRKEVKVKYEECYKTEKNKWFFSEA